MMDLEIADYERTVSTLHQVVAERDSKILEVEAEVHRQEDKVTSLQKQLGKLQDRNS